ncbi:hypothetical protein D3C75_839850 [compost metagenome]
MIVASPTAEHIVAITSVEDVIAITGQQRVGSGGAGQGMPILVADGDVTDGTAVVAITDGVGAMGIGGVVRTGKIDAHVQLVGQCSLRVDRHIRHVDQVQGVVPGFLGNEVRAVGD